MEQRFTRKDIQFLIACLIIAAISLAVGIPFFYRAFPEASIDFKITRDQARDQARAFLADRGFDPDAYRHSAVFEYDELAKTFLERQLGLEGANQLIGHPVRLWRWSNRWARGLQKEEFRVQVTTTGELVGFEHRIEEEQEGATLSQVEARYLAEQFVIHDLQRSLASLEFVEAKTVERPNRTDHSFTWKLKGFDVDEATYRLEVGIQGDRIGGFSEKLKVPEAWRRDYSQLQSRNQATGLIAGFFLILTMLAMLVVFFVNIRRQDIRWKTALIFGAIAFVLTFLASLNNLPVTEYGFQTTDTYGSFLTRSLLNSLLGALAQGAFIFFLTAAAEPVYRRAYGDQIRLSRQFLPSGICTKRFIIGTVLGLTMTAFFFAYQTCFYLLAERFGAWSPAQIPYDEMVNTYIPWIMVLLIGFMPAVSEEFISRAFSIPFLQRYLKSRWVAVFIPAVIWGFAHANYPQQPFFIRGLEVGIAGIIIGVIMLRWGILAPLVWHYTVDALYTALILLRSSNPYFVVSALLSVGLLLLPLLVAVLLYLRRRFFVDPETLLNRADSPPLPEPVEPASREMPPEAQLLERSPGSALAGSQPFTRRRLVVAALLIAASLSIYLVQVERPLDFVDYAVTADQARQRAVDHLRILGADPDTFDVVTYQQHQPDRNALKYILERDSISRFNRYYREDLRGSLWISRFYLPGQKEEFLVAVDPADGSIYSVNHLLPEEAPGADLPEDEARTLAVDHLRAYGLEPSTFELKESSSEKLDARRDHLFKWEAREGDPRNLDELRYRCQVKIAGDQPVSLYRHFKLPEDWLREREESAAWQTGLRGLRVVLIVAVVFHLLWLLIRQVRGAGIPWRTPLKIGIVAGAIFLLDYLNGLPAMNRAYQTWMPAEVFTITTTVVAILSLLGVALATTGALGLMSTFYPDWPARLLASGRSSALIAALLALIADRSFGQFTDFLEQQFAAHLVSPGVSLISGLDSFLPFWNGLNHALLRGFALPILLGIVLFYGRQVFKTPSRILLVILAVALLSAGAEARDLGEFALSLGLFLLKTTFAFSIAFFLLRDNLLAYILFGFASTGQRYAEDLLSQSASAYQVHGYILLSLVVLCILALLIGLHRTARLPSNPERP